MLNRKAIAVFAVMVASAQFAVAQQSVNATTLFYWQESSAQSIDFVLRYGISLPAIGNLGRQIDSARREQDPVRLALAAHLMAAAENMSGNRARLTSHDVEAEATDMALRRGRPAEMELVAQLVRPEFARRLRNRGGRFGGPGGNLNHGPAGGRVGVDGTLFIDNHTSGTVDVYLDEQLLGEVGPGQERAFRNVRGEHVDVRNHYGRHWHSHLNDQYYRSIRVVVDP